MTDRAQINKDAFKKFRDDSGITQEELAKLTGFSLRQIQKLEHGNVKNSLAAVIIDLAHKFYNANRDFQRPEFITYSEVVKNLYKQKYEEAAYFNFCA